MISGLLGLGLQWISGKVNRARRTLRPGAEKYDAMMHMQMLKWYRYMYNKGGHNRSSMKNVA